MMERCESLCNSGDEAAVIIEHPKKTLDSKLGIGDWKLEKILNARWQWPDPILVNQMSQVSHLGLTKSALFPVNVYPIDFKKAEQLPEVLLMAFRGRTGHQNII